MKATIIASGLLALSGFAAAQERCDTSSPSTFCNSTEIMAYESADCSTYHVFITRGSDEPYPGRLGNLTSEICSGLDDCSFESVEYPAKSTAWGPSVWCDSAGKGASAGQAQMKGYADKCPDAKLILLGFSQGGAVAQDILGGGGGKVFACEQDTNPAMDATTAPGSNGTYHQHPHPRPKILTKSSRRSSNLRRRRTLQIPKLYRRSRRRLRWPSPPHRRTTRRPQRLLLRSPRLLPLRRPHVRCRQQPARRRRAFELFC
jgi:hypothetical protein